MNKPQDEKIVRIPARFVLIILIAIAALYHPVTAEGEFSWEPVASLNIARSSHATVLFGGRIYVFGGRSMRPNQILSSIEVYDPDEDSWRVIDPLPRPLCCMTAVVDNSAIYLFGGMTDRNELVDWVLRYDPRNETVRTINHLPQPLHSMSAVNRNHSVHLMGGIDQRRNYLREGSIYNINRDTLFQASPLNNPRALFGLVNLRTVWAVGGLAHGGPVVSIEVFADNQWNIIGRMLEPRGSAGITNFSDSMIVVAGGINWEELISDRVDAYLINSNRWIELPPLSNDRSAFSLVNLGNELFAVGGISRPQHQGERVLDDVEKLVYDNGGYVLPEGNLPVELKLSEAWPNPTNGFVNVRIPGSGATIEIYNITGISVAGPFTVTSNVFSWNSVNSPAGTYFYTIIPPCNTPPFSGVITVVK